MAISLEFKAETQNEAERHHSNRLRKPWHSGSLVKNVDPSVWLASSHERAVCSVLTLSAPPAACILKKRHFPDKSKCLLGVS